MHYQITSAVEWLYPDVPEAPPARASLAAARGGRASCQVLLRSAAAGAPIQWRCEAETGDLWEDWHAPEIYQLVDVAVTHNTGPVGFVVQESESSEGYTTRQAPFRVYDALRPLQDGDRSGRETEALYVCWRIPKMQSLVRSGGTSSWGSAARPSLFPSRWRCLRQPWRRRAAWR